MPKVLTLRLAVHGTTTTIIRVRVKGVRVSQYLHVWVIYTDSIISNDDDTNDDII